jgi:putative transposase
MRKTFKYHLYPTRKQAKVLHGWLEEWRWLYNGTLAYRKNAWEQERCSVSWYETERRIPTLKEQLPALKAVYFQVL